MSTYTVLVYLNNGNSFSHETIFVDSIDEAHEVLHHMENCHSYIITDESNTRVAGGWGQWAGTYSTTKQSTKPVAPTKVKEPVIEEPQEDLLEENIEDPVEEEPLEETPVITKPSRWYSKIIE